MSDEINHQRRRFFGTAAITLAAPLAAPLAAQFALNDAAEAEPASTEPAKSKSSSLRAIKPGTNTSFAPLKQIDAAGLLNVGYAEAGPADGTPVILLHGWPYDIYSFVDVAPLLASAGYRVVVPFMRGYGTTQFLSTQTFRNAEPAVVALDTIALMDALNIDKAVI